MIGKEIWDGVRQQSATTAEQDDVCMCVDSSRCCIACNHSYCKEHAYCAAAP